MKIEINPKFKIGDKVKLSELGMTGFRDAEYRGEIKKVVIEVHEDVPDKSKLILNRNFQIFYMIFPCVYEDEHDYINEVAEWEIEKHENRNRD
jgi:hypothetical protein